MLVRRVGAAPARLLGPVRSLSPWRPILSRASRPPPADEPFDPYPTEPPSPDAPGMSARDRWLAETLARAPALPDRSMSRIALILASVARRAEDADGADTDA